MLPQMCHLERFVHNPPLKILQVFNPRLCDLEVYTISFYILICHLDGQWCPRSTCKMPFRWRCSQSYTKCHLDGGFHNPIQNVIQVEVSTIPYKMSFRWQYPRSQCMHLDRQNCPQYKMYAIQTQMSTIQYYMLFRWSCPQPPNNAIYMK